jgi:hypothetical protein
MSMRRTLIVTAGALVVTASVALAQQGAPPNDNYLESLRLNSPGQRLERKDTLKDVQNTTAATVQSDVFKPPDKGGPAEVTTCEGTKYGKTIWYDFYPDVPGLVRVRANGYDAVISVIPFKRDTGVPQFGSRACINDSSSTQEELLTRVRKGRAYTIQLGGVNDASGSLEFLFDFLADTDNDGVLDDNDNCPHLDGGDRPSGCPKRLRPEVVIRAQPIAGGIQVLGLTVDASRGSRVAVSCTRGCRTEVKRARRSDLKFRRIRGKKLSAGSRIEIRVTQRRAIGAYIAYRIKDGNFEKIERCLRPGSKTPRRRCR